MSISFDYTTRAKKFAFRHPLLADILIQIVFGIIAFLLYFSLLNYLSKAITSLFDTEATILMPENVIIALIGAIVVGALLGIIDYYIERGLRNSSFGFELLVKFSLYVITWFFVIVLRRNDSSFNLEFVYDTVLEGKSKNIRIFSVEKSIK